MRANQQPGKRHGHAPQSAPRTSQCRPADRRHAHPVLLADAGGADRPFRPVRLCRVHRRVRAVRPCTTSTISAAPSSSRTWRGMIKIEQTQYTHQAMRAIGSGFQSVLFADIRSVEDAKAARRRGARRDDDGGRRARPRPARRRHAARRRHRAARRAAGLCRCAERGGDRHHGREEVVRGRSRGASCRCRASTWCSSAPRTSR